MRRQSSGELCLVDRIARGNGPTGHSFHYGRVSNGDNVIEHLGSMLSIRGVIGHDHVQLACVHEEIAQEFELFLHDFFSVALHPGEGGVLLHFDPEVKFLQNVRHEPSSPDPPAVVRRASLELKADVILVRPLSDEGLNGGKMEAETGTQTTEVLGNHEIVLVGIDRWH